ncbi:recombinase family protein [Pseudoclavibacter sp. RFBG4]|uniref:recombinase family protein n=1 Tax=Pseudoclavibacter sp. RFBG4 TaxID=2080575 RepID=UPI0028006DDA|nr:recombinase family protein [Pseudoclavibacter sp. RFBG4]
MRAAIYVRQSLDVQEGVDRQLERCSSLISARGWTEAARYADNDTSATKARGPGTGWARMLADAETDTFDVVVAVDMDRLLRSVNDLFTLTKAGVRVLTVDGEIDLTSADGEFRALMLAAIAQFETRRKGERQRRANAYRAAQGRPAGGRRPFGFEADGMTVRDDEASAICAGYRAILAGDSLRQVARDWNAQGFHTGQPRQARTGRAGEPSSWIGSTVGAVLRNARYKGEAT